MCRPVHVAARDPKDRFSGYPEEIVPRSIAVSSSQHRPTASKRLDRLWIICEDEYMLAISSFQIKLHQQARPSHDTPYTHSWHSPSTPPTPQPSHPP